MSSVIKHKALETYQENESVAKSTQKQVLSAKVAMLLPLYDSYPASTAWAHVVYSQPCNNNPIITKSFNIAGAPKTPTGVDYSKT